MAASGKFATAINCMDGRTQQSVIDYMKNRFGVDYVDMITEPGPIKALAENSNISTLESVKRRLDISVNGHGSKAVAIVCHHDCAGNPVDKDTQLKQLEVAVKNVASWGFAVEFVKLWIGDNWQVNVIA
ncbi:MAG: hypothetical protein KKD63_08085 [Proteobacteria bacterium]|nr:hypothetical protein [Desulfobulbaceae bacterium]MBU4152823.1 hypothetical protein [Pseudomonadota bacterium]MDP2106905.1 hypothetical protein [Desulfobulbaceae bacterium]